MAQKQKQVDRVLSSPRLLVSDTTPSGLLKVLTEHQGIISILDPEPRFLHNLIKEPRMIDLLLSGYTDEPFSYYHAYKEYSFDSLCMNMCILCQPNEAQNFLENKELSDRGLLGRVLPIFSYQIWTNQCENNSQDYSKIYRSKIKDLLEYFSSKEHFVEFSLNEEAHKLFQSIQFERTQNIEPYNSFMAKIKGLIVRLAFAIHLWNFKGEDNSFEITASEIQDAKNVVDFYVLPNVDFLYGRYNRKVHKTACQILQRIFDISPTNRYKLNNGIAMSDLKKMLHAKGTELDAPLELLCIHNFIRVLKTQNDSDKIILHPRFYCEFPQLASQFPILD